MVGKRLGDASCVKAPATGVTELIIDQPQLRILRERPAAEGEAQRSPFPPLGGVWNLEDLVAAHLWSQIGADQGVVGIVGRGRDHGCKRFQIEGIVGILREDLAVVDRYVSQTWLANATPVAVGDQNRDGRLLEGRGES